MLTRRSLLAGFGALVAAPAVITTPGLLMPVRTIADDGVVAFEWVESNITLSYTEIACRALLANKRHLETALMSPNPLFARLAARAA